MQPPAKPPRRPAPDARTLPRANTDIVPGFPRQMPSPRALEAARDAVRESEPDLVQDVQISALGHRVAGLEGRVDDTKKSLDRVVHAVDGLTTKVGEWELKAAGGEALKVQEEHKTKRWVALIGLLTMIVAPLGTVAANYISRDTTPKQDIVIQSSMQKQWEEQCAHAPSDDAWTKCVTDIAVRNAPMRH